MKIISILIVTIIFGCINVSAQPKEVKKAAKSVFKLTTYKADGTIIAESNGVFTSSDGIAISSVKPFVGAARAVVTDAKGKQAEVTRILGVNELYGIAKFKVNVAKTEYSPVASVPSKPGDAVWLITYGGDDAKPTSATVKNVETFMSKYSYYIFAFQAPDNSTACPFVNAQGQVVGLMKPSSTSTDIHAIDANFAIDLKTNGFAISDSFLRQIGIPPALPEDKDQALLTLIMAEQNADSVKLPAIINDFITSYPSLVDGYSALARLQVNEDDFEGAAKTMETAIKEAEKKDEAHASYGKIIYDKLTLKADKPYEPWTLDLAAEETDKAYSINQLPTYRHQQAQITFTKGDYEKAYNEFIQLLNSQMRNPELFYEASQCKVMMKAPQSEIIALLDSAINNTDTLRIREAAPYFYARAEAYNAIDSFRQTVFDYTRYEILTGGNVNDRFYYTRSLAEIKARLYQQALADLAAAITISPKEPTYYAEMASLQLKV